MTTSEDRRQARPVKIAGATRAFKKRFKKKSPEHQSAIEEALRVMEQDLNTRSLRSSKIGGRDGVWEARASQSLRITFEIKNGELWLRNNCTHDQVYRGEG